jgi:hypothetical protein
MIDRIAEIEARTKKATDGPWISIEEIQGGLGQGGHLRLLFQAVKASGENLLRLPSTIRSKHDAAFIAHARQDIPFLLAEHHRLTEALREIAASSKDDGDCACHVIAQQALTPPTP